MTPIQVPFSGIMDLDNANDVIEVGYHKRARNIHFKGVGAKRGENIKGTRQISYTLPAGTNECIGSFYDSSKLRVIWFNYNSNGNHGIYQMIGEVITPITVCGGTDYLNFTRYPIHSVNLMPTYFGDILSFIDSLKRPSKLNIDRAIAGEYGVMERSFIDAAKEQPVKQPVVAFANDLTTTVKNFNDPIFQFAYSYVFDDKEESALSEFSEVAIPTDFLDVNALVTTNAKMTVLLQTGKANVKKIKIYVRYNISSTWSDFFHIETLDKALLAIASNTTYTYDFKNDVKGVSANPKYATLLFDSVPLEANTQELINGNIVAYGGIKEGFNNGFTPDVSITTDTVTNFYGANSIANIYNYWSKYGLGLVYFDNKGRTNGVITDPSWKFTTSYYAETSGIVTIPRINATINHRPPVWATSYQWVRTKNLTVSDFLFWVSDSTFKDDKFAYIGIQNLYTKTPGDKTESIITYDFNPGDRIRFISNTTNSTYIGKDYAIEELVNSPEIGYVPKTGFFIKIKLPTTSGTFDFGTAGFGSYLIELYSPATIIGEKLNAYYGFGEKYDVGNAGLTDRYHKGGTQDQTSNLLQTANFVFTKGDVYLKYRNIGLGTGGEYKVDSVDAWKSSMLIGCKITSSNVGNETYILGSTDFTEASNYPTGDHWIVRTQGTPYTFNLEGAIKVNSTQSITYRVYLFYYTTPSPTLFYIDVIPNMTLSVGDNTIPFSITFDAPANSRFFLATDNSNSLSLHYYSTSFNLKTTRNVAKQVIDPNLADTFSSALSSNGRPFVVDEGQAETYKDIIRFSEAYQPDTNINNTNRFYDLNYVECDRSKGIIQRLRVRGDMLKAYQFRGVLPFGIYKQLLTNADGGSNLIQSERLLNRIKYYDGEYGIGNQVCSLASSANAEYFTDPIRGYQIRLAGDGMTPISEIYKAQFYLPPILSYYLKNYTTDTGATSRILGTYDFENEEFISVFQKCKNGSTVVYPGEALGFCEPRNGYTASYDYFIENILCAESTFVSWKNGAIYIHDSETRNTFHGTFYAPSVDVVVKAKSNLKEEFLNIGYHANNVWTAPSIVTETGAVSNLVSNDFNKTEGMFTAAFLRDINSPGGINEGDFLKGIHMQIRLQNNNTTLTFITGLYCNILNSPKNL